MTDPEPLPSGHPLLQLSNLTITPHWASATIQVLMHSSRQCISANILPFFITMLLMMLFIVYCSLLFIVDPEEDDRADDR